MRTLILTAVVVAGAIAVGVAQARQGGAAPPPAPLEITMITPGLYAILNPGANTLAVRVTDEGVILVDDMFDRNYDGIMEKIRSVTDKPVRFVVSTHHHGDHTGGNPKFLAASAQIIGHLNARKHMVEAMPPQPGPMTVTYDGEVSLFLGGAEARLFHPGRGHTDGDTVVYFPDLRAMATGDLFIVLPGVPVVDYRNGGSSLAWIGTIDNILKYDFDTVIPGHGVVSTKADLQRFKERIITLQTRVRDLIRQGVTKEQYTSRLKVDDIGWNLDPMTNFMRGTAPGFYDEMATAK